MTETIEITVGSTKRWSPGEYVSSWGPNGPERDSYRIVKVLDEHRLLCDAKPVQLNAYGQEKSE